MNLVPLPLEGAYIIELAPKHDERGFFARTFCTQVFKQNRLVSEFNQISTSRNLKKGQVRGMHFQAEPYAETKIIRCTQGAIKDVIVDLRKDSDTFEQSYAIELTADNFKALYVPKGFAHGYQTLSPVADVLYMMDTPYQPDAAREIDSSPYFNTGGAD